MVAAASRRSTWQLYSKEGVLNGVYIRKGQRSTARAHCFLAPFGTGDDRKMQLVHFVHIDPAQLVQTKNRIQRYLHSIVCVAICRTKPGSHPVRHLQRYSSTCLVTAFGAPG